MSSETSEADSVPEAKNLRKRKRVRKAGEVALPLTVSRPELLVDGTDREFRKLVHGLFGFLARHEAVRAGHAARIGLAGVEYSVLISIGHLSAGEENVNINRLASHLHLSGAFITTLTNKLEKMGLVSKAPDPEDRRRVRLRVTDAGLALLSQLAPVQRQVNDVEFEPLSTEEFHMLNRIIARLIESADRALKLQSYLEDAPNTVQPLAPLASSRK